MQVSHKVPWTLAQVRPERTILAKRLDSRDGTRSHFVTRESRDPVDPVTLFYNELQMSTFVADKRLQWARGLRVFIGVWRLHAYVK